MVSLLWVPMSRINGLRNRMMRILHTNRIGICVFLKLRNREYQNEQTHNMIVLKSKILFPYLVRSLKTNNNYAKSKNNWIVPATFFIQQKTWILKIVNFFFVVGGSPIKFVISIVTVWIKFVIDLAPMQWFYIKNCWWSTKIEFFNNSKFCATIVCSFWN